MKFNPWILSGILLTSTTPLLSSDALLSTAHADAYHAVEPGETLSAIAARYKTSPDALRAANQLTGVADGTALTAMLLRVPSAEKPAVATAPVASSNATSGYFGSITKSEEYVVQPGDTLESIVARYAQANHTVSVNDIRRKNQLAGQPTAGTKLLIPIKTVYAATGQTYTTTQPTMTAQAAVRSTPRTDADVSGEVLPVAQIVPTNQPVYRAPNQATPSPKVEKQTPGRRGPSVLGARGHMPSGDLGGVRILGQEEEATAAAPAPQPKVITTAPSAPARTLAKVAKVASNGARIRRLPDSDAVSLYNCSTGTELAVISEKNGWSSILMSDCSTGWIPSRYLRETGVSVDITDQLKPGQNWASRPTGSATAYGNGRYSSTHPVVAEALKWLGVRYVYGGESRRGIDCSALMQNSFRACGYRLPRTAAEQARVGVKVEAANLQPGDRLYFSASGRRVDHTGLYMGDGMYVHASGSGRRVMVSNLFDRSSWNIFVGARR